MGLLRLLLALNVIIAHSPNGYIFKLTSIGGMLAVKVFFMISGFYMSLILSKKYIGKGSYKLFITNRWLRLFPLYYAVAILSIIIYFILYKTTGHGFSFEFWKDHISQLNPGSIIFIILTSISVIGMDLTCFTTVNEVGKLIFTGDFYHSTVPLFQFLFVPQAWTLSLEFLFYLIAPFIVKLKSRYIIAIGIISLLARLAVYHHGLNHEPWMYRFFPFEILFFLSGILSYRFYEKISNFNISDKILKSVLWGTILLIIIYQYLPFIFRAHNFALFPFMFVVIPLLFKYTKNNKLDRYVGELSFPVYICHLLVLNATSLFFSADDPPKYFCVIVIILSVLLAMLLNKIIIAPIEKLRQNRSTKELNPNTEIFEPVVQNA